MRKLLLVLLFSARAVSAQFVVPTGDLLSTDLSILAAGSNGTGVISGCAVTAQGSPNMTVAVAAGSARYSTTAITCAAGNVTITTAHATLSRIDLVVINSSGTKSATAGTAAAAPDAPAIPANSVVLAFVYIPPADTTIASSQIIDKRIIVPATVTAASGVYAVSTKTANYTILPGDIAILCDATSGNVTITLPAASAVSGRFISLKKIDASANTCTMARAGADTIDGATTWVIIDRWSGFGVISNGVSLWSKQ